MAEEKSGKLALVVPLFSFSILFFLFLAILGLLFEISEVFMIILTFEKSCKGQAAGKVAEEKSGRLARPTFSAAAPPQCPLLLLCHALPSIFKCVLTLILTHIPAFGLRSQTSKTLVFRDESIPSQAFYNDLCKANQDGYGPNFITQTKVNLGSLNF